MKKKTKSKPKAERRKPDSKGPGDEKAGNLCPWDGRGLFPPWDGRERRRHPENTIPFERFAEDMDFLNDLIGPDGPGEVENVDATDLCVFTHNNGTALDRAAALLAMLPVARQVYERGDDER